VLALLFFLIDAAAAAAAVIFAPFLKQTKKGVLFFPFISERRHASDLRIRARSLDS
jgi:hypothetical protein